MPACCSRAALATLAAIACLAANAEPAAAQDPPAPQEVQLDGDARKRYLLHGLADDAKAPPKGWRLLVVMPGGTGSADFAPFVGRIRQNALSDDWLVAQIVAPVWDEEQARKNVWPTKLNPWPSMKFRCEELFDEVVADLREKLELDELFLFTFTWSSSGTLAYTLALEPEHGVTGSFVAMSVFRPEWLPSLKTAKDQRFYILHSPEDERCAFELAEKARDELSEADALVEFATFAGGHAWTGDVYGMQRRGLSWLESQAEKAKPRKRAR